MQQLKHQDSAVQSTLEIYPPIEGTPKDRIIVTKNPTRLELKVMGLFDGIFRELDSIITTLDHSAGQFDFENDVPNII